jgi:hypothetical protein
VGYGTRLHQNLLVLAGLVEGLRPELFSGSEARRLTELFAWGERLCATGKALAAARVADTGAWESSGARTEADWLGRVSGQTAGQAAESIATAKRMRLQPDVEAAARAGTLSPEQGAAVTSAAKQAPGKTAELLDQARADNLGALRERSKEIKAAADEKTEKDRERRIHAGRYLRTWTDHDGSGRLIGRFTPDQLAVIRSALKPFQDEAFATARRAARRERPECHAADALVAMARCATGQDDPDPDPSPDPGRTGPLDSAETKPGDGTDCDPGADGEDLAAGDGDGRPGRDGEHHGEVGSNPTGEPRGGSGPGRRGEVRTRRPATVIVRIDHAALVRGYRQADECCEIDGIGLIPVATARAMMTDAFLAAVVTDGINIRSVVHLGRTVTATQRTALLARDPECVVPGCHIRTGLEIDHVADWASTKVTTIDRLARLCHHHHNQKTRDGWQLNGQPGRWQWIAPHPTSPDPTASDPPSPDSPPPSPDPPSPDSPGDRHHPAGSTATRSLFDAAYEPSPP